MLFEYNNIRERDWKGKIVETVPSDFFFSHRPVSAIPFLSRVQRMENALFAEISERLSFKRRRKKRFERKRERTPRVKGEKYKNDKREREKVETFSKIIGRVQGVWRKGTLIPSFEHVFLGTSP